ncbi:hypothetical protein KP509_23G057000 [Ceratopteris richardii]|uniref:Uncharacterized protein n=1 Tax=Ceratopteris richardii TaxID=49495 RepID=A0A8T2S025_CERRI|nr:hypothetical protein KP509_23G057000 [Ceratopteris richardii]
MRTLVYGIICVLLVVAAQRLPSAAYAGAMEASSLSSQKPASVLSPTQAPLSALNGLDPDDKALDGMIEGIAEYICSPCCFLDGVIYPHSSMLSRSQLLQVIQKANQAKSYG